MTSITENQLEENLETEMETVAISLNPKPYRKYSTGPWLRGAGSVCLRAPCGVPTSNCP